jgi:hypothetical protein
MRGTGYVAHQKRGAYKVLVGKPAIFRLCEFIMQDEMDRAYSTHGREVHIKF